MSSDSRYSATSKRLILIGLGVVALGFVMLIVAGSLFAAKVPPDSMWLKPLALIGMVCFWGYFPTGIVGTIVLLIGIIRAVVGTMRRAPSN